MMIEYVLGFAFNTKKNHVLLIEKAKPDWQCGKFNGIGGKVEEGEQHLPAMIREFKEETGLDVTDWKRILIMEGKDWACVVYRSFLDDNLFWSFKSDIDPFEYVRSAFVKGLPSNCLPNLYWLIPMCLDEDVANQQYGIII